MAKILLVEDNAMNRDMLSRRLERKRHQVARPVELPRRLGKIEALLPRADSHR